MRYWNFIFALAILHCSAIVGANSGKQGGLIEFKQDGNWGLLDQSGQEIIPAEYDAIYISDGKYLRSGIVTAKKGNATSYFYYDGRNLSKADAEKIQTLDEDGLAIFEENNLYGLANENGDRIVSPRFGYIRRFGPPLQYIVHFNGGVGVVDLAEQKWIIPNNFQYISEISRNGLALAKQKNQSGYLDAKGDWALEPGRYTNLGTFDEDGMAIARADQKCGFINDKFEWQIPPFSEETYCFGGFDGHGLYRFQKNEKTGLINRQGKVVAEPIFDQIYREDNGLYPTKLNEKWGYLNPNGSWQIQPRFETWSSFDAQGMASVGLGARSFIINRTGKVLFGENFDDIRGFGDNDYAEAKLNGKWGLVDRKGRWVVKPRFEEIGFVVENDLIPAKFGGKWGLIAKEGRWIVQPRYDCVSICFDAPPPIVAPVTGRLYFRPDVE